MLALDLAPLLASMLSTLSPTAQVLMTLPALIQFSVVGAILFIQSAPMVSTIVTEACSIYIKLSILLQ